MEEAPAPPRARKRCLLSQLICPLAAMGAFLFMLRLVPAVGPSIHDESTLPKAALWLLSLSVFVVPIIVYKLLRAVTDPK
jgi:hypothetical protein